MPRIPRRSKGADDAPAPEEQAPSPPIQLSSGDPLSPPTSGPQTVATSGDPLGQLAPLSAPLPASDPAPPTESLPASEPTADAPPAQSEVAPETTSPPTTVTPPAQSEVAAEPTAPPTTVTPPAQPTVASDPLEAQTSVLPASGDPLAPTQPTGETGEVAADEGEAAPADARPRFRQRTRMRRRLRYLRRLRELAFRDLGGLVFDLHRFGRDRNDLVTAKLEALANIDRELRSLQDGLRQRRDFTDLREAGIAACPRCGTLHDTDANFCPGCGTTLRSAIVRDASPVTVTPAEDATQQPSAPGS